MKLRDFRLFTDENVDPEVTSLRQLGFDVLDCVEAGLQGYSDTEILTHAEADSRVVVTHDADFGTLAIHQGCKVTGIVYLRPGHIRSEFTIGTLTTLLQLNPELTPAFIMVARRTGTSVQVRIRSIHP